MIDNVIDNNAKRSKTTKQVDKWKILSLHSFFFL